MMQKIEIRYTKKAKRILLSPMAALLILGNTFPYFQGGMIAILIPINILSILSFSICFVRSYIHPIITMTNDHLEVVVDEKKDVFSWKEIVTYSITETKKNYFLTVVTNEKTVQLKLWGLEKSPEEIMHLFSAYKTYSMNT